MRRGEWRTLALIAICYGVWLAATGWLAADWPVLAICVAGLAIALHASLQHEVIHGHPTKSTFVNQALVFPGLTLLIPFVRFRDTHIAHHHDARLTDPFDDPETNFLADASWGRRTWMCRIVLTFNNTLMGRLLIGPLVAQAWFMASDWRLIRSGDRKVLMGWLWHIPAVLGVLAWIWVSPMTIWQYVIAAYIGNSIIKIRTFAEHQAHEMSGARTVVIEDKGPLAFLFLNNNLHAVHHTMPGMAWYELPRHYRAHRDDFLASNEGYLFANYRELFARYFLRTKDPVPHPLWHKH